MNSIQEFLELVKLYCDLTKLEVVDTRVIETVVEMIMSYSPIKIEVKIDEIH